MNSALPLNIGVTGHRDIPVQDRPKLAAAIVKELKAMQQRFPNTTINVLCGLAEGADQLAASIALKHNFNVIAVLPFELSEY
jgi:predicted Rossmann fold nucleotide-binding protein DprA/Smf involved in DNA uptake